VTERQEVKRDEFYRVLGIRSRYVGPTERGSHRFEEDGRSIQIPDWHFQKMLEDDEIVPDGPGLEAGPAATHIARGALPERFDHALQEVLDDMLDANTDPKATRQIVVKVTFKPMESRSEASVKLDVQVKRAGLEPIGGAVFLGRKDGRIRMVTHDVRQEDAFDGVHPIDRTAEGE